MKSKILLGIAFVTIISCVSVVVGANSTGAVAPSRISAAGDTKIQRFETSDLANYSPSAEGEYKMHPVTLGGKNDHSFRINLGGTKYINGLLLHGDCGGQTITDLSHYSMTTHSREESESAGNDYYNFSIALCTKGIKKVGMGVTLSITGSYSGCNYVFNISTSEYSISDDYIVDNYSGSVPPHVSRNSPDVDRYEYLFGRSGSFTSNTYSTDSGLISADEQGANIATFRINGSLPIPVGTTNTINVTINYLEVNYSC